MHIVKFTNNLPSDQDIFEFNCVTPDPNDLSEGDKSSNVMRGMRSHFPVVDLFW